MWVFGDAFVDIEESFIGHSKLNESIAGAIERFT
jgi:hypothetical protein